MVLAKQFPVTSTNNAVYVAADQTVSFQLIIIPKVTIYYQKLFKLTNSQKLS